MLMEIMVFFVKREKIYRKGLAGGLFAAIRVLLRSGAAGALADAD